MNGEPYTIVGVMAASFDFPGRATRLWVPAALQGPLFQEHPDAHFLRVLGRLKPGISPERLAAEAALLGPRVIDPADKTERRFFAGSLQEMRSGALRSPLLVLLSAAGFLLLIACANVSNLALARAHARRPEMALRAALGARRGRLVAQLLTEAGVLAAIGGGLAFVLAILGLGLLQRFANVPELSGAQVDGSAFGFVALAATICALLFGLGPALNGSRTRLQESLGSSTRSTSGATGARHALVFAEVALAAVLLIGCALMLRSFVRLMQVDPGFRPANLITADALLAEEQYAGKKAMLAFYRRALEEVRTLPGVQSAALITHLPFGGNDWGNGYEVEGQAIREPNAIAQIRPVSPGYLATMGIPLKRGADLARAITKTRPASPS